MSRQSRAQIGPHPCLITCGVTGASGIMWKVCSRMSAVQKYTWGQPQGMLLSCQGIFEKHPGKVYVSIPVRPWVLEYPRKAISPTQCATLFRLRLQYGGPFKQLLQVHVPPPSLSCASRMKGVQKSAEAALLAAVGFSAVDHTRSLESNTRNGEKETKGNGFKEPVSSDPWERTNQTIPPVTGMYLNRNHT